MSSPEAKPKHRRGVLIGAGAALAAAAAFGLRKPDRGGAHDAYFQGLSRALADAGIARPTLIVDRTRVLANVDAAMNVLAPSALPVRVVVKSLPAFGLIDPIARRLGTNRFMVFNGAMLAHMIEHRPAADMLLGKPLPIREAAPFIAASRAGGAPATLPQWLIDTPERLTAYIAAARASNAPLRVSFEIDVGLHRGGFVDAQALSAALEIARAEPLVQISGLMGYDPHVPKVPDPSGAFASVQRKYSAAVAQLTETLGVSADTLTLNAAGSPTYKLHAAGTAGNEVAIGSAFVKPLDFDLNTLTHHEPAAFIGAPVIKALDRTRLPALEGLGGVFSFYDPNSERAFFIYGGHWLARPVSPPGLAYNDIFGRSSNQELLTGSRRVALAVDDYVFFRPTQSEALFLQFGDIAMYEAGRIAEMAPTFPVSA
ncbi:L-gulono-1,4-lactone oxidase [alpha proteobacterium U9-1i]|nr:L-gulono-1,4-lactone oxidase [alpha proteobacterium U9-1i]